MRYALFVLAFPHFLAMRGSVTDWNEDSPPTIYKSSRPLKALVVKSLHKGGLFEAFLIHALARDLMLLLEADDNKEIAKTYMAPFSSWEYVHKVWGVP